MIPDQTVDTGTVARFLLLRPHRVRQLAAEGVLEKAVDERTGEPLRGRFNLLQSVNSYVRYLRGRLAGALSDPPKFGAANEEYLASIGAGKPEAQADRNGTFSPSGADLEKGL